MLFLVETLFLDPPTEPVLTGSDYQDLDVSTEKNGVLGDAGNADASPATSTSFLGRSFTPHPFNNISRLENNE